MTTRYLWRRRTAAARSRPKSDGSVFRPRLYRRLASEYRPYVCVPLLLGLSIHRL